MPASATALRLVRVTERDLPIGGWSLVRRAQDGDQDAFATLYRQHAGRVYALCLRLAADAARADELTQDVFVHAWRKLRSFRGESAFSSWLHRLAVNVVLGERRAEGRRWNRVALHGDGVLEADAARESAPSDRIDLERAIAALPPGARRAFVLHDVEGYGHAEIAKLTGLAAGTSKAQLHRARRLLREALNR